MKMIFTQDGPTMSSTACMLARGTSQKTGGMVYRGNELAKFPLVPLNVTNSGYLTPQPFDM